eukprot:scaffold9033_cov23-Tisochrysis_lutea.AAC.1
MAGGARGGWEGEGGERTPTARPLAFGGKAEEIGDVRCPGGTTISYSVLRYNENERASSWRGGVLASLLVLREMGRRFAGGYWCVTAVYVNTSTRERRGILTSS